MSNANIPGSEALTVQISSSLSSALAKRSTETGETPSHIVQVALAKALGVEQHTLFQVSTSAALVQGVYQGCVSVGLLKDHGNFGLGTYDALDGEGLMLDGHVYRALSDGTVVEPDDATMAPFWVSTSFQADRSGKFAAIAGWDDLCHQLDSCRVSPNLFAAIRVDGTFSKVHYRVACKSAPGTNLVAATSHQAEFTFSNIEGTLLGFWSPIYARTFNIPGYHLHFLSADHRHGGHVLSLEARDLRYQVMDANNLVMALPETPQFLKADLSGDPSAALSKAEGAGARK